MKTIKAFSVVFFIFCFISCQTKGDNNNVKLRDFTKELIDLYINDMDNINVKTRKNEIIVIAISDSLYFHLSIFGNNPKEYNFCQEDFIGEILYSKHLIRIFGDENPIFFSVNEKNKKIKRCKDNYIGYDPKIWQISFYKDNSFCKMRTYKVSASEDISAIQDLAEKYFDIPDNIVHNEVFQLGEVESEAKFLLGEDSLRNIISSNFKIHKEGYFGKIPLVVNLIVDKKGKASIEGIRKSSDDIELDNEAIRVAEIISQYNFVPASHRGQTVNAIFPILFFKSDIML